MVASVEKRKSALTVFRASAGSGKTFTLATEYIKLLIRDPYSYKSILAVTFTNKATDEMKMRILSQLYGISKGYDDSDSYFNKVKEELGMQEKEVREKAALALQLLLHNYSYFRVTTIDSFFLCVLRNLAKELDLPANLSVELNDKEVEELAVDKMLASLKANDREMRWIMDYIHEAIKDDKGWNIIKSIKDFGANIFKDKYQEECENINRIINDNGLLAKFVSEIDKESKDAIRIMEKLSIRFREILNSYKLSVEDFSRGKRGVIGIFLKIEKGLINPKNLLKDTVLKGLDVECPNIWITKNNPRKSEILRIVDVELRPLLQTTIEQAKVQWWRYQSAELSKQHLPKLRLLGSIAQKASELNEEAGRFMLCNTQHVLKALISDSDSPFIFEKIGSQLEHIMIDEFQDTSTTQWSNFKILMQECISHENSSNLIVGDVKQSIYRWRSGDWTMLNEIDKAFESIGCIPDIRTLNTNYRSRGNIVRFNNQFFSFASRNELKTLGIENSPQALQIEKAYQDVVQEFIENNADGGLVEISLIKDNKKIENQSCILKLLKEKVSSLLKNGIKQRNIAILVRKNAEITPIAKYFAEMMPEVNLVSDEAFLLSSSLSLNIIMKALYLLIHPEDMLMAAALGLEWQKHVIGKHEDINEMLLTSNKDYMYLLPEAYAENMEDLAVMPLYELVEDLYEIFSLNDLKDENGKRKDESAYVSAFYDKLVEFTKVFPADIEQLLNYWEENLCNKSIHNDETDGIRIITIHKSKGLEFDNVMIPFCDWQLSSIGNRNMIWCTSGLFPYNMLPLIPVNLTSKMEGTVFEQDYRNEVVQCMVDDLNLLYVAFTRAAHNLFVLGVNRKNGYRSEVLMDFIRKYGDESSTHDDVVKYSYGSLYVPEDKVESHSQNVFLNQPEKEDITINVYGKRVEFKQSNKSKEFIDNGDEELANMSYIKLGSMLHSIFSRINTKDDVERVLSELQMEGVLCDGLNKDIGSALEREKLHAILNKCFENPIVADWFGGGWNLYNECTILSADKETGNVVKKRPDRVMQRGDETVVIDYKFGKQMREYKEQVRDYMKLLLYMGHKKVKGYLWFVYSNKIEEVI